MQFNYDGEANALYVYFDHPDAHKDASVETTVVDRWPGVNLDYGFDGEPIGLEFLNITPRAEEE